MEVRQPSKLRKQFPVIIYHYLKKEPATFRVVESLTNCVIAKRNIPDLFPHKIPLTIKKLMNAGSVLLLGNERMNNRLYSLPELD